MIDYYHQCQNPISISTLYTYCSLLSTTSNDEITKTYSFLNHYINDKFFYYDNDHNKIECDKLYNFSSRNINEQKIIYDYWLTSLIFSCFIMVLYIVLALFGFLLFREPAGSGTPVPNK